MQYSTAFIAAFAATAAAAPWNYPTNQPAQPADSGLVVKLSGSDEFSQPFAIDTTLSRKFDTPLPNINTIEVDAKKFNNQDIRCKLVIDTKDRDIVGGKRGKVAGPDGKPTDKDNLDISFADGGKGAWTLLSLVNVTEIVCDPSFKKYTPEQVAENEKITVVLSEGKPEEQQDANKKAFVTGFTGTKEESIMSHTGDKQFNYVQVSVSILSQPQSLRCQLIIGDNQKPIVATRGTNVDTTFSDAHKGPWKFQTPPMSKVTTVVCSPDFKSASSGTGAPKPFQSVPNATN